MHKRHTEAERHANRLKNFEYNHPRNKYVMRRKAKRAWLDATVRQSFVEFLHQRASQGDSTARLILSVSRLYSYFGI